MKKLLFMLLLVTLFACKKEAIVNKPIYTIDINTPKFTADNLNYYQTILCDIYMITGKPSSFYTMKSYGTKLLANTDPISYIIEYKPTRETIRYAKLNKENIYYIQGKDSVLNTSMSNNNCRVYYINVDGINHSLIRLQNNIDMTGYEQYEKFIIEAFLKIPNVSYK